MDKVAIVLFNLGGPDKTDAVRPFLFNLFKDENIIRLPAFFRYPLAWLISTLRYKKARKIYDKLGGKSPIYPQTIAQAKSLEEKLGSNNKVFIIMRYWHPMTYDVMNDIKEYSPDKIILLPLYPQLSTTTTKSSFEQWDYWYNKLNISIPFKKVCCYPTNDGFTNGYADLIKTALKKNKTNKTPHILFSAHGIPQDCVDDGDPYEEQVHKSVDKIVDLLKSNGLSFHSKITYQSKVGPKKWLLPDTEAVIEDLSAKNEVIVIVPIAFVSEHSETLVELDIDYKDLAFEKGACDYIRVPAIGVNDKFISGLADIVKKSVDKNPKDCGIKCSKEFTYCYKNTDKMALRF